MSAEDQQPDMHESGEEGEGCKTPVKPALKKHSVIGNKGSKKKELKWDEHAIEEHDQLRGTRMKIDEPNTPYTYYDSCESDDSSKRHPKSPSEPKQRAHFALNWDDLESKLAEAAANHPSSPSAASSDGGNVAKKRQFREHRKQHYNEMEAVRKFREQHGVDLELDDLDDHDDADDEKEEVGAMDTSS